MLAQELLETDGLWCQLWYLIIQMIQIIIIIITTTRLYRHGLGGRYHARYQEFIIYIDSKTTIL